MEQGKRHLRRISSSQVHHCNTLCCMDLLGYKVRVCCSFSKKEKIKSHSWRMWAYPDFLQNISQDPHTIVCCCNVIFHCNVESVKKPLILWIVHNFPQGQSLRMIRLVIYITFTQACTKYLYVRIPFFSIYINVSVKRIQIQPRISFFLPSASQEGDGNWALWSSNEQQSPIDSSGTIYYQQFVIMPRMKG